MAAARSALGGHGIFPGVGEMAERMRSLDWSSSPLGPVDAWPQSLRTSVSMMLSSRQPMLIFWGPELVQLYNDGFRPILGRDMHPEALGAPGKDTWGSIWDIVGPDIERVMSEGAECWHEDNLVPFDRSGFIEEIYFTYSYSPIWDETGHVGGVLVVCTETTRRVVGARQMGVLRDLGRAAAEAFTAEEACTEAVRILRRDGHDVPFACAYLIDREAGCARRVQVAGLASAAVDPPATVALVDETDPWHIAGVARDGRERILETLGTMGITPSGPWPEPCTRALVLPIARAGSALPAGVLVAGLSPRLPFRDDYADFLRLAASHLGAAVGNARAHEEERRRANALAELDRAKTSFFADASHELRTPLMLILGPLQDALRGGTGLSGEGLSIVHRNTRRLLQLVNGLLDVSRIEAGRIDAKFEPTDLARLTIDLASHFRAAIESAGLRLDVQCERLAEPVWVDPSMWEKVVFNLLSNALKFTFDGGITITLSERDGGVALEVRDSGVGIPESELPRLFERFYRVRGARARTHEGTGIGLALAQELVTLHGGRIEVQSREGEGTIFTVWLPHGPAHLPESRLHATLVDARPSAPFETLPHEAPHGSATSPVAPPPPGEGRRILVVDDNADMRTYLRNVLAIRGAVETASDGDEALAMAWRAPPDIVVTDVSMPGRDGFELIGALRSDPRTARVPVIVVSAYTGEEARVEGLRAGADDYVAKPFSSAELLARVDLQLEVVRARELAEHERRKLLSVFEQAPVAIFVYRGRHHVIELVNPLACELLTRPPEQLLGRPLFEAVPELREQGYEEILARVLDTGERFRGQSLEATLERDGERVTGYFDFICEPMREVDGSVAGVVCIFVEVTARVLAQRTLAEQRARLEEANAAAQSANRAKDEFLALLGHELRNPLAPISAALDVMRMKGDTSVGKEREVIHRQVEHMSALVSDLLDVSRVVSGKITLYLGPVRLSEAVRRSIELTSPLMEANLHRVRVDVAENVWLLADPVRLTQIISNVLTNAARYTDPEGHIEVWTEVGTLDVALHIRDDGVGIDAELLPRVFEMFAQAPRPIDRRQGGLGLGLALGKNLVGLHGGEVTIHSDGPGGGTEVVIRMPTIPAPAEAAPASGAGPDHVGTAALRVLVVDDNEDAANLLASALRRSGHSVESVYGPVSALERAQEMQPDVILLDIGLPVMDGYEVARRIRALGLECTLIAVTGYGQLSDVENASAAGFDRHMIKPVDLAELRTVLAEIGRSRGASRVVT